MRRFLLSAFLLWPLLLSAQGSIPVFLGRALTLLPPTVDASGKTVVFGSAVTPDGANLGTLNLYSTAADGTGLRRLTDLPGDSTQPKGANAFSLSANAGRAAFTVAGSTTPLPSPPSGPVEEVHLLDVSTGADRVVSVDTQGCILPLQGSLCVNCFFSCVHHPHITADGTKVLYSVSRSQPFFVVNADGTGLTNLPVNSGTLAPAAQRVISRSGLVVFTSTAPATGAPPPPNLQPIQDVFVMSLNGTNIQNATKFSDGSRFLSNATISADGATIAFELTEAGTPGVVTSNAPLPVQQIWMVRSDGSGLRALTSASDSSSSPSISGDGSLIAFVRNGQIFMVRSDGSGLRALTNFQMSSARDPVIAEDGSLIVFAIGPRNGGIGALYAIKPDGTNLHPVYAPRALNQSGIVVMTGAAPAPGSLFSAFGLNIGSDSVAAAAGFPLPSALAGVSLLVNGAPTPLLAVTPWQVNAQLPANLVQGPAAFQLRFADGASPVAVAADVKSVAPVIFILPAPGNIAPPQAAAFHANSAIPVDRDHPAVAGEVLEIYGTGLGPTNPLVAAGVAAPASPPARTLLQPQVLIGNLPAQVTFAGLAPGLAGVYQVNAVVPDGLKSGPVRIDWKLDSTFASGTIWLQ